MTRCLALFLLGASVFFHHAALAQDEVKIIATLPPIAELIQPIITKTPITLETLIVDKADPHHFTLRPSQIRKMQKADAIMFSSVDDEPYMKKISEVNTGKAIAFFNNGENKSSHEWLSPKHISGTYASLPEVLGALIEDPILRKKYKAKWRYNSDIAIARLKIKQKQWLAMIAPITETKAKTILFSDSSALQELADFLDLELKLFTQKTLITDQLEHGKHCIVMTHGANPLIEKAAGYYKNITVLNVDLTSAMTLSTGGNSTTQRLDGLISAIAGCLT